MPPVVLVRPPVQGGLYSCPGQGHSQGTDAFPTSNPLCNPGGLLRHCLVAYKNADARHLRDQTRRRHKRPHNRRADHSGRRATGCTSDVRRVDVTHHHRTARGPLGALLRKTREVRAFCSRGAPRDHARLKHGLPRGSMAHVPFGLLLGSVGGP